MSNPFRRPSLASGASANSVNKGASFDQAHIADAQVDNPYTVPAPSVDSPPLHSYSSQDRRYDDGRNDSLHALSSSRPEHHSEKVHALFQQGDSGRTEDAAIRGNGEGSRKNTPTSIVPPNPFGRSSAAINHTPVYSTHRTEGVKSDLPKDSRRVSRALDVDSFKNLLLTGSPTPLEAVTESAQRSNDHTLPDGSSSTDASSVSRQSIFETMQGNLHYNSSDSRRSSNDLSAHESERLKDRSAGDRKSVKIKPPPPRHRHGKTLTSKGPQTVSFDDFIPTGFDESRPALSRAATQNDSSRDGKLLPPSPPSSSYSRRKSSEIVPQSSMIQQSGSIAQELVSPRKSAPPPPLTRRSTVSKRPRSNTTSSIASQSEEPSVSHTHSVTEGTSKSAPPPPPTRRLGGANSITSIPQQITSVDTNDISSTAPKSSLPPSVRHRSSSQVSSSSTVHTGAISPPPRPPPRRMSSRGSIDLVRTVPPSSIPTSSRTSSEFRRPSLESEQHGLLEPLPSGGIITEESDNDSSHSQQARGERPQSSAGNILADMEAFQREVDELRAKSLHHHDG